MKRFLLITGVFIFALSEIQAQQFVTGTIYEATANSDEAPLMGANVYWLDTTVGTITNDDGEFKIPFQRRYSKLIVSYVGFKTDTITINEPTEIKHWLIEEGSLNEVVLQNRKQTAFRSYLQAQNVTNISSEELLKAACCNLSESFETNPSIDVNFPDALTGTRQIRMLGLTSPYTLITLENIPAIRGASQTFGLSFVPGTWVESIQVSKGAGSVVNGFESIAGQINAELQKPATDDAFFVNAYAGNDGRFELNNHLNFKLNEKWHTGLYLHGNLRDAKMDSNDDGFLDMPLAKQLNLMNRWQYMDAQNGFVGFLNIRYLTDQKQIGQVDFNPDTDKFTTNSWGGEIKTSRAEASLKLGYVFPEIPYQSIGVQMAYSDHKQESYFGLNVYDIHHKSFYSNVIFGSIIGDSRHNFKTGISFFSDNYNEQVLNNNFERIENAIGGFFEYSYDNLGNLNLIAGVRLDHHNQIGTFVTPRVHARYTPWDKAAFKGSFGRGVRAPSIFAENQQLFSSARNISILNSGGNFYGLDAEDAWNYGISFLQGFRLFNRDADITFDFYRTDFVNQIVVDWEDPQQVVFYNLDGSSYANSFQTEVNLSPAERVDVRLSYRLFDVQTDYLSGRLQKPLTPKHRIFANAAYETKLSEKGSQWKFDATYNWLSEQRFPNTISNPEAFRVSDRTPQLNTLNAQITKVFSPKFEIYVGGENITNVKQNNPIVSADDPFGPYFDTSLVYGPIFGSMYYTGLRWKI
ncbi:MAG: TonB-dependent receptor [Flavobacteriaceae bacterium]|nr:TonB-dependent receptor [Flavobacteriaceae bacterium]